PPRRFFTIFSASASVAAALSLASVTCAAITSIIRDRVLTIQKRYIIDCMLQLSASLLNKPVLSLRTSSPVAATTTPIINPDNLKIEGFYCIDNRTKQLLVLVYQDIRELIPQGFIVNDFDVLAEPKELVR